MNRFINPKLAILLLLLLLTNLGSHGDGFDVIEATCQCAAEELNPSLISFVPQRVRIKETEVLNPPVTASWNKSANWTAKLGPGGGDVIDGNPLFVGSMNNVTSVRIQLTGANQMLFGSLYGLRRVFSSQKDNPEAKVEVAVTASSGGEGAKRYLTIEGLWPKIQFDADDISKIHLHGDRRSGSVAARLVNVVPTSIWEFSLKPRNSSMVTATVETNPDGKSAIFRVSSNVFDNTRLVEEYWHRGGGAGCNNIYGVGFVESVCTDYTEFEVVRVSDGRKLVSSSPLAISVDMHLGRIVVPDRSK